MSDREILELILSKISNIESDVATLKNDVNVLKADVATLKNDVEILKSDVAALKSDVEILKSDVATLKSDVSILKEESKELNRRMNIVYDQVANLTEFQTEMRMFREEVNKKFDFIIKSQDIYREWLAEHEIAIRLLKKAN
ncbi:hypothetical protein ACAG39_07605 [Caldicellulosiruptoraceae bacterium PP1]